MDNRARADDARRRHAQPWANEVCVPPAPPHSDAPPGPTPADAAAAPDASEAHAPAGPLAWWGPIVFHEDGGRYYRIGPFELWIERRLGEWQVRHTCGDDARDPSLVVDADTADADTPQPPDKAAHLHLALHGDANAVRIGPRLADRSVVFSPSRTLVLPPQGRVTLYATSPLWLEMTTAESGRKLLERALWRPSDTWFGDTTDGELCYSSRLHAARDAGELLRLPHRAVTPLDIANERDEPLIIDRLNVPVRTLSLFRDRNGQLWTEPVRVVREQVAALATVTRSGAAPREAQGAERVAEPRDALGLRFSARVFLGFFGVEGG